MNEEGQKRNDDRTWQERFQDYMVNDGPKLFWIFIWLCGNIVCFVESLFHTKSEFICNSGKWASYCSWLCSMHQTQLRSNISLRSPKLFVMVHSFIFFGSLFRLRGSFIGSYLPVDKNIIFHRYIAWSILFFAGVHTIAHFINFNAIANVSPQQLQAVNLSAMSQTGLAFLTIAGITGHITFLIMVLMYSSAVRSPMFNVFWYTHHLFVLFYIALALHGAGSLLGDPPSFWYWTIGSFVLYALERTMRLLRGNQDTILQLAVAHPSKVLELQMKKSTFNYKPGQYLFLNCPYIAAQEWHPFTISSAPEEDFVSVHIRIVGDWTGDLWNFLNPTKKLGVVQENLLSAPDGSAIFRIDGPFGAASEDTFDFSTVMLVAGGIGVTPFGSILKSCRYRIQMSGEVILKKVYFYWISRDKYAFEWFSDLLAALEQDNINNFLEINTYLTGQLSVDEIKDVMYGVDAQADQITGLQSPTHFGRPNWDEIFKQKAQMYQGKTVGVFFCGPAVLSKQLYKCCRKYTSSTTETKFKYHKENF